MVTLHSSDKYCANALRSRHLPEWPRRRRMPGQRRSQHMRSSRSCARSANWKYRSTALSVRPSRSISIIGRDGARVHMQIDIGFGDVMTPGPEMLTYPTILDFPAPKLSGYSRETVAAEKLQALAQLRMLNIRMKDYFDLWLLTRQPELNKDSWLRQSSGRLQIVGWRLTLLPSDCHRSLAMTTPSRCSGAHF